MFVKRFIFNPIQVNTYLAIDEKSKQCVLIDAGCLEASEQEELATYIRNHDLQLTHVLNTHLHLDHCFGNAFIYRTFGVGPEAHRDDENLLGILKAHAQMFGIDFNDDVQPLHGYLSEGDVISFGESRLSVIHVPGHSRGGLAFYSESDKLLFSGDSLFKNSIGRTDLHGGNYRILVSNLITKIMILPGETDVYPGHGDMTTIEDERLNNPYLQ
ncbi:MAG: MBL fold metallo-hydrolase [Paludibacteraceae bacterium]|nr:MBL fold metallo-hydrolase [Paludibacteraceae bacterium]